MCSCVRGLGSFWVHRGYCMWLLYVCWRRSLLTQTLFHSSTVLCLYSAYSVGQTTLDPQIRAKGHCHGYHGAVCSTWHRDCDQWTHRMLRTFYQEDKLYGTKMELLTALIFLFPFFRRMLWVQIQIEECLLRRVLVAEQQLSFNRWKRRWKEQEWMMIQRWGSALSRRGPFLPPPQIG